MLLSPAQNPDVIAGFYEAASHADGWGGAWSALCTAFSADTGLLYRQSRPAGRPQILAVRNWPEASHNVAIDRYLQADPDPSHAGTTEAPYHVLSSTVLLDGTAMIGLGLHRKPEAPRFTEEDRAALDGVGRHVAVALRLEALLAAERQASAIRGSALDLAPYGVLIANGRGEILFANRAAEEIAAAGGISLGHGRSCIGHMNPHEAEKLEALITSVAGGRSGGCTRVTRGNGMSLLAAIVEPLPVSQIAESGLQAGDPEAADQSLVMITLRDLAATFDTAASYLMDLFGLTAAEAGIVPQLLSGESVSLIAQSRGVALSTVKAQAAKVLAKTGASNLRALSTMIAALGCG